MELSLEHNDNDNIEDRKDQEAVNETTTNESQSRYTVVVMALGHVYRLEYKEWVDLTHEAIPIFIVHDNHHNGQFKLLAYAGSQAVFPLITMGLKWKFACASQKFISLNTGEKTFGLGFNHPKDAKEFARQLTWVYGVMQKEDQNEETDTKIPLHESPVNKIHDLLLNREAFDRNATNLLVGFKDLCKVAQQRPTNKKSVGQMKEERDYDFWPEDPQSVAGGDATINANYFMKQNPMAQEQQRRMKEDSRGPLPPYPSVFEEQNKGFQQKGPYPEHLAPNSSMEAQRRHSYTDVPHQSIRGIGGFLNGQPPSSYGQMDTIHESQQGGFGSIGRSRLQSLPTKGPFDGGYGGVGKRDLARPPYAVSTISDLAQASFSSPAVVNNREPMSDSQIQRQQLQIMNAIQQGYQIQQLFGMANLSNFHLPGMPIPSKISDVHSPGFASMQATLNSGRSKSFGTSNTSSRYSFSPSGSSEVFSGNLENHSSRFKYSQGLESPYSPSLSSNTSSNAFANAQLRHLNNLELIGSPASPMSSEALHSPFSPVPQQKFDDDELPNFDRMVMGTQPMKMTPQDRGHEVVKRPSLNELITAFEPLGIDNSSFASPIKKANH